MVFTAVAAIVVVVIIRTATRLRSAAWAVSLGLVLGGAAGNLVDRLCRSPGPLRGHVVDWISLRTPDGRMLFPIFNFAASGIVCGGILAVLLVGVARGRRGWRTDLAVGVVLGLALLTKAFALMYVPWIVAAYALYWLTTGRGGEAVRGTIVAGATSAVVGARMIASARSKAASAPR